MFNHPIPPRVKASGESVGPLLTGPGQTPKLAGPRGIQRRETGRARRGSRVPLNLRRDRQKETGLMRFGTRMKSLRRRLGTFAFTALALSLLACVS